MSFFSNQDINRLALHTALHQAAMGLSLAFFAAFLLHTGRSPAQVFLVIGTILVLRFFLRLGVPGTVRLLGFRNTLLLGSLLFAVEYLVLAAYDGSNVRLMWFIAADAVCSTLYWTCYHAYFASAGDAAHRGHQIGAREALACIMAIASPVAFGWTLVVFGPRSAK